MPDKIVVPARGYRAGVLEVRAIAEGEDDDRRATLSFSSEEPLLRDFGFEILGHGEGEVDLSRLASGRAALLTDHSQTIDAQVGVVERAWIEDGKGRATVRFGRGVRASEILARVRDGEITGASVGYSLTGGAHVGERDGQAVIRVSWMPYEITLCPVPADPGVGLGRSADGDSEITLTLERKMEGSEMPNENTTTATPKVPAQVSGQDPAEGLRNERSRVKEIRSLGKAHNMPDEKVDAAIDGDVSVDKFTRSILDHIGSDDQTATRAKSAEIGLSAKEVKDFSLMRAVRYLADPTNRRNREAAAFEIEASDAAQAHLKRDAKGLMVPPDVLTSQTFGRSQNVGTPAKGGALVDTQYLDSSFIGLLRRRAALSRLGVRMLTGLEGNVSIPRQTGGGTAFWVGEAGAPTDSDAEFGTLALTPHTLAAAVPITRRAMLQTSPDIEALVRDDLIQIMALEMDRVAINGDADADAPDGLLDMSINTVDWATAGQPTFAEVVAMETEISADDADVDGMKYLFPSTVIGHCKSTPKVAGTAEFIAQGNEVNGFDYVKSNNAPAAAGLLGNWNDFIAAWWSGLDLTVDSATLAASGGIHLRAFQDMDFGARHVESFCHGRNTG